MKRSGVSNSRTHRCRILAALASLAFALPLEASFHLMQIEQVIGGVNGDTAAQAVQLRMRDAGQNFVAGSELVLFDAAGNNPLTLLIFGANVNSANTGSRILITTSSFASYQASPIGRDFIMNAIPASYLPAGRLAFRNSGVILWSVSWGNYTGPNTGSTDNDANGNFGPPFAGAMPSTSTSALRFNGTATAASTTNAADYSVTPGAATFTNNAGASTAVTGGTTSPTPSATPTATPSATPLPTPVLPRIGSGPIRIELQEVASGLTSPVDLITADDGSGRLFIVQQTGQIVILQNGQIGATPFLDVSARLVALNADYDERGLLGLAFHPGFNDPSSPGYQKLYTYTNEPVSGAADFTVPNPNPFDHQNVIAEWKIMAGNPDRVDAGSRREVIRIDHPQSNHNGGKIAFRPSDQYLYVAVGDGGGGNDVGPGHTAGTGNAQDLSNVLGKILRIDPIEAALTPGSADPASANGKYRVPVSNPFIATLQPGVRAVEIYAYGLRNPFRFSFDAAADKFIVADVGQNNVEEIDVVEAGGNYGWNRKEGSFLFDPADGSVAFDVLQDPSFHDPIAEYGHLDGQAVIGGFVYHGTAVPALNGRYVFGDLSSVPQGGEQATGRLFYLEGLDSRAHARIDGPAAYPPPDPEPTEPPEPTPDPTEAPTPTPTATPIPTPSPSPTASPPSPGHDHPPIIQELRIGYVERKLGAFLKGVGQGSDNEIYLLTDSHIGVGGTGGKVLKLVAAPASPALVNIATRLRVETGDNVLIGGFILIGGAPKRVMLRGIGPSLAVNGQPISGRLLDPILTLYSGNSAVDSNDDWTSSSQQQQISDSGIAPVHPKESAIIATLEPGNYTAELKGVGGNTGIGVVELYDLDQAAPANPANIASRGLVQTGDDVMIGGFIIGGSSSRTVLVRAIGPALTAAGVPGALQDPTLALYDAFGALLESNDNWRSKQEPQIIATGIPPSDNRESAILSTLPPGNYTAIVRGSGNTTGVALVEIYQLQP